MTQDAIKITVYLSKYALTSGIEKYEANGTCGDDYVRIHDAWNLMKMGRDCFKSFAEAQKDAEKRRIKKIASLKKSITKLEKLTFEEQPQ